MHKTILVFVFIFTIITSAFAQDAYHAGVYPNLTLRKSITDNWQVNTNYSSRNSFLNGTFGEEKNFKYDLLLTDFSLLVSRKLSENHFLAGGYLFRIRSGEYHQRFIQQYTYRKNYGNLRTWHRVRTEQQIAMETKIWKYSFRYRFALEIPLNPEKDEGTKFSFRLEHEYIPHLQKGNFNLDNRSFIGLVSQFSSKHQLTAGPAWWISRLLDENKSHHIWLQLGWRTRL